jgi:hypothetical protein
MKIKQGVVYNPTIHHGYLLEKIIILGAASHGMASTTAYGPSAAVPLKGAHLQGHGRRPLTLTLS